MHELGITRNIVAIVDEAARGRRVLRVTLEVGKLSGVETSAIAFCFDIVARGTALDGATLVINEIEGRARCRRCGGEVAVSTLFTACGCGARDLDLLQGEELKVKAMELADSTATP